MLDRQIISFRAFPKFLSLQGLRAVAMICIFYHHTYLQGTRALGSYGVSVFLILSGFLMGGSYLGNNKEANIGFKFVIDKISNLYLLHIITTLSIVVYNLLTAEFEVIPSLYGFIVNALMILPYCHRLPIQHFNDPSWYLGVCVITYLVFPLILRMMRRYRTRKVAYIVIAINVIVVLMISFVSKQFTETLQKDLTYYLPISRIPEFVIGCNMGFLYVSRKDCSYTGKRCLSIIAVCLTLATWYIFDNGLVFLGQEYFRHTALYLLPSALMIYSIANNYTITNIFESKILVIIGDLSPYAFLIHLPVIWYMRLLFISWDNDWRIVLLSFLVTLLLSAIYMSVLKRIKKIAK